MPTTAAASSATSRSAIARITTTVFRSKTVGSATAANPTTSSTSQKAIETS
jgi:hypothetical protein